MEEELERKVRLLLMIKEAVNSNKLSDNEKVDVIKIFFEVFEENGLEINY